MRIGYYIPGWPPGTVPNGIVTTLGHLGQSLRELGHEVFYITPRVYENCADAHVSVLEPRESILDAIRFKWNLEEALYDKHANAIAASVNALSTKYGIDVFQMEETHGWASRVIQQAKIPIVVRLHGPWHLNRELGLGSEDKVENRHRVAREGKAIFGAAAVTAPSENVLSLTEKFYGRVPSLARAIPNPIDTRSESERWKLDECDRNLVLFVGRFDQIKGADLALKAFATVAQERPDLRLLFVGPDVGLKSDHGSPMNFEQFALKEIPPSVRNRVQFTGILKRPEIEKLRARAYVTVVASRYETFGNVVIEAMAFGCPIVATGVGGISEILTDARNGLVAPASVAGLVDALVRILDNPELAARLGANAAIDCSERFNPTTIALRTVDFYSTVIDWKKSLSSNPV
jgi:glycosyltransferase involved in cell wall biosynthesis